MGRAQFTSAVGGEGGTAIATSTSGTVQTDNYDAGNWGTCGGSTGTAYPLEFNPAEVIHEFSVATAGDVDVEITTVKDVTFTVRLDGATGAWDHWDIDKIVVQDPRGTGALFSGGWAGE